MSEGIPYARDFRLAREKGGAAAQKVEIGVQATIDIFVGQNVHRDRWATRKPSQTSDIPGGAGRALWSQVEAPRVLVGRWQRRAPPVHLIGRRRRQLRDLPLECFAFMQDPKLKTRAVDRGDPFGVEAARADLGAHAVIDFPSGDGINPDALCPDLGADRGIERPAAKHVWPAGVIGQHDVVQREPPDRDDVNHERMPSSVRRRSFRRGPIADE